MKIKKKKIRDICTKGTSSLSLKDLDGKDGDFPVYGAAGLAKKVNFYQQENKYLAIIKDGSGVGRLYRFDGKTSVLGTMQYIFPSDSIDYSFCYYALQSIDFKKYVNGAAIPHIYFKDYSQEEIPLPAMEEQKKIAARLDAVSDLLAKQKQLLSEQDNLIQSTFYDMFGDPIKNEKGWKIEKLSSVSDSRLGKMLDAKKQNEANQYPYLANYNVQWFCFNLSDVRKMSFDHNEKCEFELKKGDVLVCEGGDVGRCAIWKEQIQECYFQKALHRVRCNPNFLNPIFLMHLFYNISICNGFEKIVGNKATIAHLTGVKLKALEIPVPQLELQQKFAAVAEQIESEKSKIKSAIAETQTLFNALMAEYFEE